MFQQERETTIYCVPEKRHLIAFIVHYKAVFLSSHQCFQKTPLRFKCFWTHNRCGVTSLFSKIFVSCGIEPHVLQRCIGIKSACEYSIYVHAINTLLYEYFDCVYYLVKLFRN